MPYFIIEKIFLVPSFELDVKQQEKIFNFLSFLENSGVAEIISKYVKNKSSLGGRPGYNYYHLFAVIIYGFAFKRYTLRELEDACKHDIRFIFIMEQQMPDHSTICDFINKVIVPNESKIFSCLNIQMQKELSLSFKNAYIDGTKYEANANKYKFVWKPIKWHKNLSYKIGNIITKYNLIRDYKTTDFIKSSVVASAISNLNQMKEQLSEREFKSVSKGLYVMLEKILEYEEKERICGPNRKSYYKTDHDATAMALKTDYYSGVGSNMHAAYNVQLLVCEGYIFTYCVSQDRNDINVFIDILDTFYNLYKQYPSQVIADAGYGSLKNYSYLETHNIKNFVKFQSWEGEKSGRNPSCYHLNEDDTITCINGNIGNEIAIENRHPKKTGAVFFKVEGCNSCNWMPFCKRFMKRSDENFKIFEIVKKFERQKYIAYDNLCSTEGIELRVNRSIQVEGVFGITKQDFGYVRTRRRGLIKVSTEIMLNSLGFNIAKLLRFYETGKKSVYWTSPTVIEKELFIQPNQKRLVKKGRKINAKVIGRENLKIE